MRRLIFLGIACCLVLATCVVWAPAYAADPLDEVCKTAPTSPTCLSRSPSENPLTGPNGTLLKIATILSVIAGVSAVIILIVSGLRYITSGGDTQKVASAKNGIIGALIGIVVIVLAQTIVTFIVRRL